MSAVEAIFGGALALGCLMAMASDLHRRVIPNGLCLALALMGLAFGYQTGGLAGVATHALHMVAALGIGLGLFAIRWAGGGDGKFYAACAAWFPLPAIFALLSLIAIAGLMLVLVWFGWRRLHGKETFGLRSGRTVYLPFGVAIGLGALTLFGLQA